MRRFFTIVFIFLCSMSSYSQIVNQSDPIWQGNLAKPNKLQQITEPHFNTKIIRLSDAVTDNYSCVVPQYSKRQAWNSDGTKMLLQTCSGDFLLFDGNNYNFIKQLDGLSGEDVFWNCTNPQLLFFSNGNSLNSYNISDNSVKTLRTFPDYMWVNTRGEGNLSNDCKYWAFVGQTYNNKTTEFKDIVVYDIASDSIISKMALPKNLTDFDWVSISPGGTYVVIDYATSQTGRYEGLEIYNSKLQFLWQKPLGAGHSDLATDINGKDVLVMGYYDADKNIGKINKYDLATGQETNLLEHDWSFDLHISCRNTERKEWCFISTFDGEGRLSDDSLSWLPFEDEIFALKMDGSKDVHRLAHHRSRRFSTATPDRDNSVYYAEPHATVNRTGTKVLFGSNWRENVNLENSVDSYMIDFTSQITGINENEALILGSEISISPNPALNYTKIRFSVSELSNVKITLYDNLSNKIYIVADNTYNAGSYELSLNLDKLELNSGIYYYVLEAGNEKKAGKLVLVK